ncbi:MAG: hypothetical protein NC247_09280 [Ruminococcus flavefaciens]|nr:hypothetical protein [Ruminococcus flavefaciens]MCM1360778.1 hypothetical protein [Clostridiales bacterium]MCM1435063.1 hypothetical protein [Ruminococcus flavefaciens]
MKWIIIHVEMNKYLSSGNIFVDDICFAKQFSTEKQAEAYLLERGLDRSECVCQHTENIKNKTVKFI